MNLKNIFVLGLFLVFALPSVFADIPYFFSQDPTTEEFNSTSGFWEYSFDVGQDGPDQTTVQTQLYLNDSIEGPILLDTHDLGDFDARDFITDSYNLTYNADHYILVTLTYSTNPAEVLTNSDLVQTYTNGVDYVVVSEESGSQGLSQIEDSIISPLFVVIGAVTAGTVSLYTGSLFELIMLGVILSGIISILILLVLSLKSYISNSLSGKGGR